MNDYKDPFTNYEMKGPKAPIALPAETRPATLDIETLRNMGVEGLINLVQRISAARWGEVANMNPEAIAEAMKLRLAHGGLTQSDIFKAMPVMREWFDRTLGKPKERVEMLHQKNVIVTEMTTAELVARLEARAARGALPDGVKMIEGKVVREG